MRILEGFFGNNPFGKRKQQLTVQQSVLSSNGDFMKESLKDIIKHTLLDDVDDDTICLDYDDAIYAEKVREGCYYYELKAANKTRGRKPKNYVEKTWRDLSPSVVYKYTIKFNGDGTISLYYLDYEFSFKQEYRYSISYYNPYTFTISRQIINFIQESPFKLKEIGMRDQKGNVIPVASYGINFFNTTQLNKIGRKFGNTVPADMKFGEYFASNFPENILTRQDPSKTSVRPSRLYIEQFETMSDYLKVVKSCVDAGYTIIDEDDTVYNSENIDEMMESGETIEQRNLIQKRKQDEKIRNAEEWIISQLGETIYKKYLAVKQAMTKSHFYLYQFNSNRKSKKMLMKFNDDFFQRFASDNGIDMDALAQKACGPNSAGSYDYTKCINMYLHQIMYAMAWKLYIDNPNGWNGSAKNRPSWRDWFEGYDGMYGWEYASLKDLSFAMDDIVQTQYLYYLLSWALVNSHVGDFDLSYSFSSIAEKIEHGAIEPNVDEMNISAITEVFVNATNKFFKTLNLQLDERMLFNFNKLLYENK